MRLPSTSKPDLPAVPLSGSIDTATLELLAAWKQQDATTDPEQIRVAERELAEFKEAMNDNRKVACQRVLYP